MSVPVGVGHQVNTFEQVSSDNHQMSLAGGWHVQKGVPLTMWPIPWCMWCYLPLIPRRHLWKHYISATTVAGGNYLQFIAMLPKTGSSQIPLGFHKVTVCQNVLNGIAGLINERLTLRNGIEDLFYSIIKNYSVICTVHSRRLRFFTEWWSTLLHLISDWELISQINS